MLFLRSQCFSSGSGDHPSSSVALNVVEGKVQQDDDTGGGSKVTMFRKQWHRGVHEPSVDQRRSSGVVRVALRVLHPLQSRVVVDVSRAMC